ncbi:MAG TPA: outer membrane protein assembly factor BamB [Candidatus Paenalcaligenes intestinipullorum]|uniref:Outer membrane protein assembly factor BamB n=1 Tax=Candidatus Paenalcaligenes intestinipullorum TaxID=2838718 RepID=A0A9D2U8J6_9BURK|nr:outer membrane protein assembly factor BamB [Candidatus Paenalcaligenes intestinipullorum]
MMPSFKMSVLAGCLALSLATLSGCSSTDNRYEPTPLSAIEDASLSPVQKWSVSLGGKADFGFAPTVVGGYVYAASTNGQVVKVDLNSGSTLWSKKLDARLSAGVGADGRAVVVATHDGYVIALNDQGEEMWRAKAATEVNVPPVVGYGIAVVRTGDYRLQAFDLRDGAVRWSVQRPGPALALKAASQMEIIDGLVFAGMPNGRMMAIDAESGAVQWEETIAVSKGATDLERIIDVVGAPQFQGPIMCAAAYQGRIACFDLSQGGMPLWNQNYSTKTGPASDSRFLFVANEHDVLNAFTLQDGINIWTQNALKNRQLSPPTVITQALVVGDYAGVLHFLSRSDGRLLGRINVGGGAMQSPLVGTSEGVVLQTGNGNLLLVDAN